MPSLVLEVRASNTAAQRLYERFGFRRLGRLRQYYKGDGEDALVMETPSLDDEAHRRLIEQLARRYE